MLTQEQKEIFERTGLVRIPDAFSVEDAVPMRELILEQLVRQCGFDPVDPSSWRSDTWPKFNEIKFDPVFEPIGGEMTRVVLDELLGEWEEPSNWGQFIVQFPKPNETWTVPHDLWHTDFGYDLPSDPLQGVLLISFITDVGPKNGGTGFIEGSHKLVEKYVNRKGPEFCKKMRRVREALMSSEPWLIDLANPDFAGRTARFMDRATVVNDCQMQVVDLTGETGDLVIAHPWLLHASSRNCGNTITMRRVQRIRSSLTIERMDSG